MPEATQLPAGAGAGASVTMAICCHNGAKRLRPTLAHLRAQIVPPDIQWEVLFIDNASTDGSAQLAQELWGNDSSAPLRIVREPLLGVRNARERALKEAKFELIGFVDDDTWLGEHWVAVATEVMAGNPALGAVGGLIYPAYEATPPFWWYDLARYFGLLLEAPAEPRHWLNTGGTAIRKSAWQALISKRFRSRLVGRYGKRLSCGEDNELTYALHQAGWELRIEPRLRLLHFIEADRMTWPYMRRMVRSHAASWVMLHAIFAAAEGRRLPDRFPWLPDSLKESWQRHVFSTVKNSLLRPRRLWRWAVSGVEGDPEVLEMEHEIGGLIGLLTFRNQFTRLMRQARERASAQPGHTPARQSVRDA
ncbi:MAG: glycosyltransferase [Candidatus Binataceae bacterium]